MESTGSLGGVGDGTTLTASEKFRLIDANSTIEKVSNRAFNQDMWALLVAGALALGGAFVKRRYQIDGALTPNFWENAGRLFELGGVVGCGLIGMDLCRWSCSAAQAKASLVILNAAHTVVPPQPPPTPPHPVSAPEDVPPVIVVNSVNTDETDEEAEQPAPTDLQARLYAGTVSLLQEMRVAQLAAKEDRQKRWSTGDYGAILPQQPLSDN